MNIKLVLVSMIISLTCFAPGSSFSQDNMMQGTEILKSAIEEHGGSAYETAHYAFVFRGKTFIFHNHDELYEYSSTITKDGQSTLDKMDNSSFVRMVNGTKVELSEKKKGAYREGLNSVIYFATLPHKLQDIAVNNKYIGEQKIKGQDYDLVQVTFDQEGGGKDHDDTFMYWINKNTHTMDFLAYSYQVGKGGVRFRSAYNPRRVDGIIFQDYVNYKAELNTPLDQLGKLWENDELEELSRIDTENVRALN